MRNKEALLASVMAGLAAPGSIGATVNYRLPTGSDLDRMRQDVERVGRDFTLVIRQENGKKTGPESKN